MDPEEYSTQQANVFESICQNCYIEYFFHKPYSDKLCHECWLNDSKKKVQDDDFELLHDRLMTYSNFKESIMDPDLDNKNYRHRILRKAKFLRIKNYYDAGYLREYKILHKANIKFWRQQYRRTSFSFRDWRREYRRRPEQVDKEKSYKKFYNKLPHVMEANRLYQQKLRDKRKLILNNKIEVLV